MYILKDYLRDLLINSMPYRNVYSPTIEGIFLFYILPVILGFIIGRHARYLSGSKNVPVLTLCYLSLRTAFLFALPWLILFLNDMNQDLYLFLSVAYLFLLIPVMIMIGISLNFINNNWLIPSVKPTKKNKYISYTILILLMILIGVLNSIPVSLSKYPVGADVYFHIASTNLIAMNNDFFSNPRFYDESNPFYPPLFPLIISILSKITNISIIDLWRYYPLILSPIFVFLIFYFAKLITQDYMASIMAVLFLFPWREIVWMDYSPKLFAWSLLILVLIYWHKFFIEQKKKYLILSIFIFLLIMLSHIEIAVHGAIIIGAYLVIEYLKRTDYLSNKIKNFILRFHRFPSSDAYDSCTKRSGFYISILLYFIVFSFFIYNTKYYISGDILVFNEIALSVFNPIGAITLIPFILTPIGLITMKKSTPGNTMIISILFLYSSVFFYFSLIWEFYHRYFSETAYIGFAILSGTIMASQIKINNYFSKLICYAMIGLIIFSFSPRIGFLESYSIQTQEGIDSRIHIIEDIKNIKDDKTVILTDPNDIINRYIPAMAGKYIFAASISTSKEQQWQVISVPSYNAGRIQKRVDLATDFLKNPEIGLLKEIKKEYKLTHILLRKSYYNKFDKEMMEKTTLIAQDDGYILLRINF